MLLHSLFIVPLVYAASSPWTQTDWSGGVGASTTNQYSAASSTDATTTSGQVTLTNTEKLSNTGFESNLTSWNTGAQPSSISGLQLWLKADAITGLYDGDSVTTWTDSSGNSRDATQSTAGNKPTYKTSIINSQPVIRFDGSDDEMSYPSAGFPADPVTLFTIYKPSAVSGRGLIFTRSGGTNTVASGVYYYGSTVWSPRGTFGQAAGSGYFSSNQPSLFTTATKLTSIKFESNSDNPTVYLNGSSILRSVQDGYGNPDSYSGNLIGKTFNGDIAEIIVYNSALSDTNRQNVEAYLQGKYGISSGYATLTRDTSTTYNSSAGSAKLVTGSNATAFNQSVNVGDTNTYNLSAYARTDGSAVTSSDVELFYNGSTISTTYTSVGSGWYKLTGTLTGANASRAYGVQVKANKTVYVDNMSLNNYASSGTLTSSIFDTEFSAGAAWGALTYTSSGSTVAVKVRTSNSSSMTGATDFSSCTAITSGSDISSNSCITDSHRYVQYQLALSTSDTSSTPSFSSISLAFATYDADAPSISLTALSPDPNSDTTPTLSGTATDTIGTVSNVQFQMDSTSGSWTTCTASDGSFNSASEAFSCTASTLTDGSHTMYVRATDSNSNTTASASYSSTSFTVDATAPVSIDLDSPGDNSYTNSERPSFKWKATSDATAGLSKYVLEVDNPSIGSSQPSGDFTIDSIPTSRTTDYETNKYTIKYENFSDSDSTNNYISVSTKSHSDWSSSENDGKLREGRVSWKVKAVDNAGNETSSSRTLFLDRSSPKAEFTQINEIATSQAPRNDGGGAGISTTDITPTIYGKITDSLAGGDSGQSQNDNGPKVASGPKNVEIKIEKKEGALFASTNKLITLYTINMDKPYYTCDGKELSDNSKHKCDKYVSFQYTPKETLELGTYIVTIIGKDKADNTSSAVSFTLNITTLDKLTTPEEKKVIEEELKDLPKEQQEEIKKELEITKPTETPKPNILEQAGEGTINVTKNVVSSVGNGVTAVITGIGNGISATANAIGSAVAFTSSVIASGSEAISNTIKIATSAIGNGFLAMTNTVGQGYNHIANNAPGVAKNIMLAVGSGVSATGDFVGDTASNIGTGISNTGNAIAQGFNTAKNATGNTIANIAFTVGQKTEDISHEAGTAIIKFGYLFVPEPTKIYEVKVLVVSPTSAKVYWKTNHPANGKVNYGLDETYPFDVQTEKRTNNHEFTLTNLKPDTEYHFEVMSQNRNYVYDANRKFRTPK